MENIVKRINIADISNLEDIKSMVLSKGQSEVVISVVNNGQLVPVLIDSDNKLIDGRLRVHGNINIGKANIDAIIVKKNESAVEDASSKYIINTK